MTATYQKAELLPFYSAVKYKILTYLCFPSKLHVLYFVCIIHVYNLRTYSGRKRLNKLSDDRFIQPGIYAEASQIPFIAEQNLRFCSRFSAKNASEWRKL